MAEQRQKQKYKADKQCYNFGKDFVELIALLVPTTSPKIPCLRTLRAKDRKADKYDTSEKFL
jgi:hypothetical protein